MNSISHPFRFSAGKAVKVAEDTDAFSAQMIAAVIKTGKGEMPLNPDYGVRQAEFSGLDRAGLTFSISAYHPNISINKITEVVNPSTADVEIRIEFTTNQPIG